MQLSKYLLKNAEIIKYKRRYPKQKELLNLFNDLWDTVLTDNTLKSKSQKDDDNENENDKILISSNEDNENEDDNETMSQNKKIYE